MENMNGIGHESGGAQPPVAWTPEGARHMLIAAVHEAQKPLVAAVGRPGVPLRFAYVALAAALVFVCGVFYQLVLAQGRTATLEQDRMELVRKAESASAALGAARQEADLARAGQEHLRKEAERLQGVADQAAKTADEARRVLESTRTASAQQETAVIAAMRERYQETLRERDEARQKAVEAAQALQGQRDYEKDLQQAKGIMSQLKSEIEKGALENELLRKQLAAQEDRITALAAELKLAQQIAALRKGHDLSSMPESAPVAPETPAGTPAAPGQSDAGSSQPDQTKPEQVKPEAPAPETKSGGSGALRPNGELL